MRIRIKNSSRYLCWKCNYSSEVTFYFSTTYPAFFTTYGEIIYKAFSSDIMAVSTQERQGSMKIRIELEDILFFETESNGVNAHTRDDIYQVKYRLYELEEILPVHFLRISKSAIINVKEVYSLSKSNLSTTSVAAFSGSYKQVFVSRHYVRQLKEKLTEMRMR